MTGKIWSDPDDSVYVEVRHDHLELYTSNGWILVEVLPGPYQYVKEFFYQEDVSSSHGGYPTMVSKTTHLVVSSPLYRLKKGSAVEELSKLRTELNETESKNLDLESELAGLKKTSEREISRLKDAEAASAGAASARLDTIREYETSKRVLEADIAKIRTAIGDDRMREILKRDDKE